MTPSTPTNAAALTLRVGLGAVFLAHSVYLKLFVFTLPGTAQFFGSIGLPGWLAYGVFAAEAIGGLALLAGVAVRPVAAALLAVSLGATWAHSGAGWLFTNTGGGWEFPAFLALTTAVQLMLGAGDWRVRLPQASEASRGAPALAGA
ncbi:MAG: DoxX family protein [Pseudomonadota bacterium]